MRNKNAGREWDMVVKPRSGLFKFNFKELFRYSDLIVLLAKRDLSAQFKQTLLGPVLLFVQPLATALAYTFFFGMTAKIGTDGTPRVLFYLAGLSLWSYFSDCLTKTSVTLLSNSGIFGKVYFPRLVVPLSVLLSNMAKLSVILIMFLTFWIYFLNKGGNIHPHLEQIYLIPFLIILVAGLGMGAGLLISSITTKYRDLSFLVQFGVQLLMFASSVVIPLSSFGPEIRKYILLNPVCIVIETFKHIFLGQGLFSPAALLYSFVFMIVLLFIAILSFNRAERTFIDTV